MKTRVMTFQKLIPVLLLCPIVCIVAEVYADPYLDQQPPGLTPQIFAPDVISLSNRFDFSGSFTPDGNEFYFTVSTPSWFGNRIMITRQENGVWTTPSVATFSGSDIDWSVYLSPDGQKLFFSSGRPNQSWVLNIWMCERQGTDWSDPIKLDMNSSQSSDYAGTCTWDGTLYFASGRDGQPAIYKSIPIDGRYNDAEKLPFPINTVHEINPYIAPDESYLLFASERHGNRDIYISYRNIDDSWTEPVNLGTSINNDDWDGNPFMSPDGKYLFFARDTGLGSSPRSIDLYWVEAHAAFPDPNGPIENLSTSQRFSSINCAINYANEGDTIVISPGIYNESIFLTDKTVLLQSVDPNNPSYIGGTTIQGSSDRPVVTLQENSETCEIAGLTIRAGSIGIVGIATDATIRNCRIMDNVTHGMELSQASQPHLLNCLITSNGQTGITMLPGTSRSSPPCTPVIENCVIVQNGEVALIGGQPVVMDCIIED
ncbi:MAG: right-handed parallel beta-helix repeat-containing protein [Phycisphaerales bacterium]